MGTMQATFAEFERQMAKERNKERYDAVKELGRWPGGRLPYGWRYDRAAARLVPEIGGTADVLHEMAEKTIAGQSQGQIAAWLNNSGHLTVIGNSREVRMREYPELELPPAAPWKQDTVRRVLRSTATAELLGESKAAQLRAALRSREQTRGERVGGHLLLRVAYCSCGAPLYCQVKRDRPSGGYYKCGTCNIHTRMDMLEHEADAFVRQELGRFEHVRMELLPGDDHQTAIHALERDIAALEKITGTDMVIRAKEAEIEHLRQLPFEPDRMVPVPQGISIEEYWSKLGTTERRGTFLRQQGVRVTVDNVTHETHWSCKLYGTVTSHGTRYLRHPVTS